MIPTALVFPALLRKANTPPSSVTVRTTPLDRRQEAHAHVLMNNGESKMLQPDRCIVDESEKGQEMQQARAYIVHNMNTLLHQLLQWISISEEVIIAVTGTR